MSAPMTYEFDRFLRYDELVGVAARDRRRSPRPRRARDIRPLARGTRALAGHGHRLGDGRPRHQAGALGRRQHPRRRTDGHGRRLLPDPPPRHRARGGRRGRRAQALRTRTFYVVPRVNPDGAEWVLADQPRFRRSSTRPWPWRDAHRWPGLHDRGRRRRWADARACASPIPTGRGCRIPRMPG